MAWLLQPLAFFYEGLLEELESFFGPGAYASKFLAVAPQKISELPPKGDDWYEASQNEAKRGRFGDITDVIVSDL